ncbi:MAG: InlB B-repeat-containing protein, partial [Clostridia bacterium]|nr:InlB B-repeat-containing protein [Clostridia bacterium]
NTYTVTYAFAGGTHGSKAPTPWTNDAVQEVSAPTRTRYTFAGWTVTSGLNTSTAKYGPTNDPATAISAATTKCINGATGSVYFKNLTAASSGSVTLTANWTANTYTATYDAQGGSVASANKTVSFGSTYGDLLTPTRTGYDFLGWRLLPVGYRQVEYIQGSGSAYVLTDYTPNHNTSVRMVATPTTVSGNQNFWCARGSSTSTATFTLFAINNTARFDYNNSIGTGMGSLSAGTKYVLSAERNRAWLNDSTALSAHTYASYTAGGKLTFMASYVGGEKNGLDNYGKMRVYGVTVWSAGTIAGYYVPCYRTSDNAIGLYDVVENKFFAGTGSLTKGGDVYVTSATEFAVGKNVTLYAVWSAVTRTITLDNRSATTAGTTSVNATYDSAMPSVTVPTKVGYDFGGYYSAVNGGGTQYYKADGTSARTSDFSINATLYAKWTAVVRTVTLDGQSATNLGTTSVNATYDSAMPSIDAPARTGYTFGGYYTAVNGGGTQYYKADGTSAKNSDYTSAGVLYAKWTANTYTVTFNGDGGTVGRTTSTVTFDSTPTDQATATYPGYTFGGFFRQRNGSGTQYFAADGSALCPWDVAGNTTLYAKWTANDYTIRFSFEGGRDGTSSSVATFNAAISAVNVPTRTGYTFAGYYTEKNGSGTKYFDIDGVSDKTYSTVGDLDLFAKWDVVTYTVTYELNGGTNGDNPSSYTIESASILYADAVRTGYDFSGWYLDSAFTSPSTGIPSGSFGDVKVYAKWTPIVYTITYNYNGGEATTDPTEYTIEDEEIVFGAPVRSGFDFMGWFSDEDLTEEKSSIASGSYGDVAVYAKWEIVVYDLSYYLSGGANGNNPQTYTVLDSFDFVAPTRTGYTFDGWYADDEYVEDFSGITLGMTGDRSVYAKWTIIEYDITYHLDGGRNDESNPSTYTVAENILFADAIRAGFTFVGWYMDEERTVPRREIPTGTTGNIVVYALFDFDAATISGEDLSFTYTGQPVDLVATVEHGILDQCEVDFEWVEHGAISPIKTNVYPVKTVADSGVYTLRVTVRYEEYEKLSSHDFRVEIGKATLTVKAVDYDVKYGDEAPFGYSYVGLLGTDNTRVVSGTVTYTGSYESGYLPGEYVYTPVVSGLTCDNYILVAESATITVGRRPIRISATQSTVQYDGTAKTVGYTMEPSFFYGFDEGTVSFTVTDQEGEETTDLTSVGERTVSLLSTYPSDRFDVTVTDGYLVITRAELIVEALYSAYVYDGEAKTAQWRYVSGLAVGDSLAGVTLRYTLEGETVVSPVDPGTYTITIVDYELSAGDRNNYSFRPISNVLSIGTVPIYIDVESVTEGVIYDGMPHTIGYGYRVHVGDSVTCDLIYYRDGVACEPVHAGTYTVTADLDSVSITGNPNNYNEEIIVTEGTLVIEKRTVSFDIVESSVTFDGTVHDAFAEAIGLIGEDRAEAALSYSDNINAGDCAVSILSAEITVGDPDNYVFDLSATGTMHVEKRLVYAKVVDLDEGEVYDGMRHYTTAALENAVGETSFTFELSYGDNVLAGTCPVSIVNYYGNELDERNYDVDISDEGYLVIHKAEYDFTRTEAALSTVSYRFKRLYNGKKQYPAINVLPVGRDGTSPEVVFSDGATDVAEGDKVIYLSFVSHSDNYNTPDVSYELTLTIAPYACEVVWEYTQGVLSVEYSGGKIAPGARTYDINGEEIALRTVGEEGFGDVNDVGYSVTAYLPAGYTNYTLVNEAETFTVTPKSITVRFNATRPTYDGTVKSVTATAVGVLRGERVSFNLSYDREPIDAGTYSATASLVDCANYVLTGTTETTFDITRRIAKVVAHDLTSEYGQEFASTVGEYDVEGFIAGDEPIVTVNKSEGDHVGMYLLVPEVEEMKNYDVRIVNGRYEITPTAITVFVKDHTQKEYNSFALTAKRGTEETGDWYLIAGSIPEGDDPDLFFSVSVNKGDKDVPIACESKNTDYNVTFVGAHEDGYGGTFANYHVILESAYLYVEEGFVLTRVYDGQTTSIPVKNSGNGKITAYIKNKPVKNLFSEVGVYEVTFKGTAEMKFYAPEDLTVTYTILPAKVEARSDGVTFKSVDESSGFTMDAAITVVNNGSLASQASSSVDFFKKVTDFYTISVSDGSLGDVLEVYVGNRYKDGETVSVCLYDGSVYSVKDYVVQDGFITIEEASQLQGIGLVEDDSIKGVLIIISAVSVVAIVVILLLVSLIFRGRRRY